MLFDVPSLHGQVTHDALRHRDTSKSWSQLRAHQDLDSDLLQVEYPNGLLLDAGWHADRHPDSASTNREAGGAFWVVLIRAFDWQHPVLAISARDFAELRHAIQVTDDYARVLSS